MLFEELMEPAASGCDWLRIAGWTAGLACYQTGALLLVPRAGSAIAAITLLCLGVFGLGLLLANQQDFKQDVSFKRVATVAALEGAIETGLAAFVVKDVGNTTRNKAEYDLAFILLAAQFTLGTASVFVLLSKK